MEPTPPAQLSEPIQWELVATLYDQTPTLVAGGVAMTFVALVGLIYTRQPWFGYWAAALCVALAGRVGLNSVFRHDSTVPDRVRVWRTRFAVGAWLTGLLWGAAALVIINDTDPRLQMFVVAIDTVVIIGAAARNAGSHPIARGQIVLGLVPLFFACVLHHDPLYRTFALFTVFEAFAAFALANHLHRQLVRFLLTAEHNVALVDAVRTANLELAAANTRLEAAATTDALTGIANRRRFDTSLAEAARRAQRDGTPLALLMLDIDAFKAYNDAFGHPAGDVCLRTVAQTLAAALRRPGDLAARYGGEEFAAILPQTDVAAAAALAQQIRADIEALGVTNADGLPVTASVGVAAFGGATHGRIEDALRAADDALYRAKTGGRNRVYVDAAGVSAGLS